MENKQDNNLENKIDRLSKFNYNLTHYLNDSLKMIGLMQIGTDNYQLGLSTFILGCTLDFFPENIKNIIPSYQNIKPNKYINLKLNAYKQSYNLLKKPFN